MNSSKRFEMDEVCELASDITAYIWSAVMDRPQMKLEVTEENGDIRYCEEAQDIFLEILDIVDNSLNPEEVTA